jgi:predicted TPR repeat methyltransferase
VKQHSFKKEKQLLEQQLKTDPENVVLLDQLAFVYLKLNLFAEAEKLLEKALIIMPNLPILVNHLGMAYLQNKNFQGAEICFKKAVELTRDDVDAMCNLSIALRSQDKKEEALASLIAVLEADQNHVRARYLCGKLLCEEKLFEEADVHFRHAVSLSGDMLPNIIKLFLECDQFLFAKKYAEMLLEEKPGDFDVLYNLGVIESRLGQSLSAAHYYQIALKIYPDHFPSLNNLAVIYLEQQNLSAARYFFERALALQPGDVSIQYTLSAMDGKQKYEQAPVEYVKELFDGYADHFEKHLVQELSYQTHTQLFELFSEINNGVLSHLNILDLGCGTGLCGPLFKSLSDNLVGVDLSRNMLNIAGEKKCYNDLIEGEISEYLKDKQPVFDLIVAADVIPYFGELRALFALCKKALKPGGCFLFSTEVTVGEKYIMQKTGRFSHSTAYIEKLASENEWAIIKEAQKETRRQKNSPSTGGLFLLAKR